VPRRGYRGTLVTAFADPHFWVSGDSPKYFKVNATAQGYVPLGGQLVIATGVRYDHGFPLGGAVLLPKTERFFAGGDTTVRGVDADMLRTQNTCIDLPGAGEPCLLRTRRAAGGNIRIVHNLELEFPWLASKSVPIGAALFLDTGLVADSFAGFSLRSFRHSVGFAPVRVKLPIGFLSFEYAFPLDPEPGDDPTGRFHFNFGFVF
jgi:outer membrane protein insertion porin family